MPESAPKVFLVGNGIGGGGSELRFRLLAERLFGGAAGAAVLVGDDSLYKCSGVHWLGWQGPASYPRIVSRLHRLLVAGDYDVLFTLGFYPNLVGWLARKGLRRPPRFIASEITRPEAAFLPASGLAKQFRLAVARRAYRAADLFTANSIDGLEESVRLYGIDPALAMRVPNVIDPTALEACAADESPVAIPTPPYFITVTRFDWMKRLDDIITAFMSVRLPTHWRLLIVGGGVAAEETRVRALAAKAGGRIQLTGWLDNPLPLIKTAAGFLHASSHEGYSNSILEALFCDTPVVSSFHSTDARQMCAEGAALGFEVGDREALAGHMERLANEPRLAQALIAAAKRYRAPYEAVNAITSYEDAVYIALGQPKKKRLRWEVA